MIICAIDPGKSGALVSGESLENYGVHAMPQSPFEAIATMKTLGASTIYLEEVGGYAGGAGAPGAAMFNFGRSYAILETASVASGASLVKVRPQKWQKALSLGTRGERTKPEWKRHLKDRAQELFPKTRVSLLNADALLIFYAACRGLI